jgi:hypothetical protein
LNLILIQHLENKKKSFYYKKITDKNKKNILKNDLIKIDKILIFEKYKRNSVLYPLPKDIIFKPIMRKKEVIAFSYFMKPGNIYFEFGSGGSTNIASYYNVTTFSVESDIKWHRLLKKNNIKANYITVDLKAQKLGYPGKGTNIEDWKKYIQAYKKEYNADIILIDGRFRVACGLDIFNKIRNDTIVLIHNYIYRKEYKILENYYLKLKRWNTLAAFIKKPGINIISKHIYQKYMIFLSILYCHMAIISMVTIAGRPKL